MMDRHDPQLLGEAILQTRMNYGCTIVQAADTVYDWLAQGWRLPEGQSSEWSPGLPVTSAAPGSPKQDGAQSGLDAHGDHTDGPTK